LVLLQGSLCGSEGVRVGVAVGLFMRL